VNGVHVYDVDEATFERDVLQRSKEVPVVVDFWAAWCGPCRTLGPMLERLATQAQGDWVLAKVDVDRNPGLAGAFGVQGIPAVRAFKDGLEVDEFVGALPEASVRRWLAQLGPSEADLAMEAGGRAEEAGDLDRALESYREALGHEPGRTEAKAAVERVELAQRVGTADRTALEARLAENPADVEARTALADALFAAGAIGEASALLVDGIRAGLDRNALRTHLVRLLDTLSPEDPRALEARRELAGALF